MSDVLRIKLFADLGKQFGSNIDLTLREPGTIRDVLDGLEIPVEKVAILMLNNRHAEPDTEVCPGDVLGLFPPVGGG